MRTEDVAIVGIGCRFPEAHGPEALWELLCARRDAVQGTYDDRRLDIEPGTDGAWVERLRSLKAGLLDDIDAFDAAAFNISAREARLLDPQQRLMLETAWEAIDDAGLDSRRLEGHKVGVYAGIYGTDYQRRLFRHCPDVDISWTTGGSAYALAGRISYAFGFQGPSFTIETACSASLVAVHEACAALASGQCEVALAGGINLLLDPTITLAYLNGGALAPDSRCKFGDASANGYVRSEGVGLVVLKPLTQARADGDRIYAVIRSTVTSHTGQTGTSLFTPGIDSQVALFGTALARAGLSSSDLDYIEAHGTGTKVGDRVELSAVSAVLGGGDDRRPSPCLVGSVKTNIGHTESAAGIAGVIKAALCLQHGEVPPSLHFRDPNPEVPWNDGLFRIPTGLTPIGAPGRPAKAAVNSFGITGTIACAILEQATPAASVAAHDRPREAAMQAPILLPLSARSPPALKRYASALRDKLRASGAMPSDYAHSTALKRTHHDVRLAAIGRTADELADALELFGQGEAVSNIRVGASAALAAPKVAWVFCGQGPQWPGMGLDLFAAEPVFRAKMEELDALIHRESGISVLDEIRAEGAASRLDRTDITQPAIFAIQVALAEMLTSWNLNPAMIVGHSVGEVAAALTAGALTTEDAVRVVCARGRITEKAAGWGKMAAVELSMDEAEQIVRDSDQSLNVAAINGPQSITLAGLREPLEAVCQHLTEQGRFARMLDVDYPSHCMLLNPLVPEMAAACMGVGASAPAIPLYSTVVGRLAEQAELASEYWARNLREPVLFASAIEAMAREGADLFVEIGPHPALLFSIRQVLEGCGSEAGIIECMRRDVDGAASMRVVAGEHYVRGAEPNWSALVPPDGARVPLPAYPWDHERYWIEEAAGSAAEPRPRQSVTAGAHPLLQHRFELLGSDGAAYWQSDVSLARFPWLADHAVRGRPLFPAAGHLVALLAATGEVAPGASLDDVEFHQPLHVPADGAVRLQIGLLADSQAVGGRRVIVDAVSPEEPGSARTHVTARMVVAPEPLTAIRPPRRAAGQTIERAAFYQTMARRRLDYGARFQEVASVVLDGGTATAKLAPAASDGARPGLHPATIDACLQVLLALTPGWGAGHDLWLPQAIKRVRIRAGSEPRTDLTAIATGMPSLLGEDFMGDVLLIDDAGTVLLSLEGVRLHRIAAAEADSSLLHEIRWIPQALGGVETRATAIDPERVIAAARTGEPTPDERAAIAEVVRAADRLAGQSVQAALGELGVDFTPGRRMTFAGVVDISGILPHHHRLLRRLLAMLCEDGVLVPNGDDWRVVGAPAPVNLAAEVDAAGAGASADVEPFWRMFGRAALNLASVLTGRIEATELLFGGEGAALLEQLYARHLWWQPPIREIALAVEAIVDQLPAQEPLRILEVGAGTGGVTGHLLPLLPAERSQYVFTDLSRYFLDRAQTRFAAYPFVSTHLLDIEHDPAAQGLRPGSYDMVVAANCLHATADLTRSVEHAASLLRPGGLLLLQEETRSERWTDLIFGLTDGWWRFTDAALRPEHALLTPNVWKSVLETCGFETAAVLGGRSDDPTGAVAIVAQKQAVQASNGAPPWLLLADGQGVASRLARRLAERGQASRLVDADAARGAVDDYVAAGDEAGQTIVDLRPLDARIGDGDDPNVLAQLEDLAIDRTLGALHALIEGGQRHSPRFVLVTAEAHATGDERGPVALVQATLCSVIRNAALENPRLTLSAIDLDDRLDESCIDALASELLSASDEPEVALRRGRRRVRRLVRRDEPDADLRPLPAQGFALEVAEHGKLDGFAAIPAQPRPPAAGEVQIRVRAAGVNFHDVMVLLGAMESGPLGFECAGVVSAIGEGVKGFSIGDAVVAAALGTWRSHVNTPAALVARQPAGLRPEVAAGLPIAYLTAHHALHRLARVKLGQRVLVHAAAGGFGFASLHTARAAGAEVIGTAGNDEKRAAVLAAGAIGVHDSRSLRFADAIRASEARPIDIVVNSLAGDFIPASLDLLAEGGTFIEVGKQGIWTHDQVRERRPDVTYHVVDLEHVMRSEPQELERVLPRIVAEIEAGALPALPVRAFAMSHAVEALRFMQEARQIGKIILSAAPGPEVVDQNGAALITGGLSGLGLEVARWLAQNGTRRLILAARKAPDAAATAIIGELRERGVQVWAERYDVGEHAEVAALIARCGADLPPLTQVFHLAGVLDDAPVHQLDSARFATVYRPKVLGAWSLHRLTRDMPIERFVLFSSWTALLGSPGQANHASASAFLDALAHHRRAQGLAAQSINWGGWSDTGSAADPARLAHLARQGLSPMSNPVALGAMEQVLASDAVQVAVSPFDARVWREWAGGARSARALAAMDLPEAAAPSPAVPIAPTPEAEPERDLRDQLGQVAAGAARRNLMEKQIVGRLSQVLRTPARSLDVRKPFKSLGLDSLTALELRNGLEIDTKLKLPASVIFNHASVTRLATELATQMGVPLDAEAPSSAPAPLVADAGEKDDLSTLLDALRALPEEEALRFLAAEEALQDR